MLVTEPAVALKLAELAPDATVTDAGTGRAGLLLETDTTAPPLGAVLESVTVHAVLAPGPMLLGVHESKVGTTVVTNDNEAV